MASPFTPPIIPGAQGYPLGLTGATAATRYVGATASGAPASGTFAVGDFVIDQSAAVYICTVAGSPGTWVQAGGGSVGTWATWSPTLTAATPPTLGTAGSTSGRYVQTGKTVIAHFNVTFGTSGTNAGVGTYYLTLPVNFGASASAYAPAGTSELYDASATLPRLAALVRDSSNQQVRFDVDNLAGVTASATAPWAWAANDQLSGYLTYEGA